MITKFELNFQEQLSSWRRINWSWLGNVVDFHKIVAAEWRVSSIYFINVITLCCFAWQNRALQCLLQRQ